MLRLLTACAWTLLLAVPAYAQTGGVSGAVVDESGAAVPGATVQLALTGRPAGFTAFTGVAGDYAFRNLPAGTYHLSVELSGFAPAMRTDITVGAAIVSVPAITLVLGKLNETVVVSASRIESQLVDAPATMSVLTSQTLKSSSAATFGDLLRTVPGVNVVQLSARDINLTSRQATSTLSNSQLVLLDGRSIYLDFFGIVLWDFVPSNLSDIKQIEVVRGPASAVWGANALTGVVNIITKSPREAPGAEATLSGGLFSRNAGSSVGRGAGLSYGANATLAEAPNAQWSYRISAGYFNSDPFARPSGTVPLITDPRDPTGKAKVGGAKYPADGTGAAGQAFLNSGTSQPKFDARIDQELNGGRIIYEAGVAGTAGTIYTGVGPFDIQPGSRMSFAKVGYSKNALKVNVAGNFTDATAPNLLLTDPTTSRPLLLNFSTQSYDFEAGNSRPVGTQQVVTFGGNVRQNNFDLSIAPNSKNRTEFGGYVQDDIQMNRVRFSLGGRVDKFGNLSDPVFSPRIAAIFKPVPDHSIRLAFNRAFRSPSVINNYLDTSLVVPTDLSGLAPLLPAALRPAVAAPFPLIVKGIGSTLPVGATAQTPLTEESLTAYEIAYTGTLKERTTIGVAFYVNDHTHSINFTQLPSTLDPYTAANPPPGWPLPPSILSVLASQGIFLPRTAFTYLNLGPLRQKGVELSVDHRVNKTLTAFANYSWQSDPNILDDPHPYPIEELGLPPTHRFNTGFNYDGPAFLGSASINYSDSAFWSDVLTSPFFGFTDSYTMVNGAVGVKMPQWHATAVVKVNNLLNQDIQQHVFGDILKRSVTFEVRVRR